MDTWKWRSGPGGPGDWRKKPEGERAKKMELSKEEVPHKDTVSEHGGGTQDRTNLEERAAKVLEEAKKRAEDAASTRNAAHDAWVKKMRGTDAS